MKSNVGTIDRMIRTVIGIALLVMAFFSTGGWAITLAIFGTVLLITAIIKFCPLYAIFGIDTCEIKNHPKGHG